MVRTLPRVVRFHCRSSQAPTSVIATGDLTTWGTAEAFERVLGYLRDQIYIGSGDPEGRVGLNDPEAMVLPGNHDIWSGTLPGLGGGISSSTRSNFNRVIDDPAPSAVYPGAGKNFPYQRCLYDGTPGIYLYGLDSTRVDEASNPRWRSLLAQGFINPEQLADLETLISQESDKPCVRIASLHHPLAYPQTTGVGGHPILINLDNDVLPTLQKLGFTMALCGHQHWGFVRPTGAVNTSSPPIRVFSVGTSTQVVGLSRREKQLLSRSHTSLTPDEQNQRHMASQKCNEFRIYEFETDPQVSHQLNVIVHVYRFYPHFFTFVKITPTLFYPIQIQEGG